MEQSNNDEEAPKDPGAMKALTGFQDNEIFGTTKTFGSNAIPLFAISNFTKVYNTKTSESHEAIPET
jgi:hypothetical protein